MKEKEKKNSLITLCLHSLSDSEIWEKGWSSSLRRMKPTLNLYQITILNYAWKKQKKTKRKEKKEKERRRRRKEVISRVSLTSKLLYEIFNV